MTEEEIEDRVKEIRAAKGDPEVAHSLEDKLHFDVLEAIANGLYNGPEAEDIAKIAIKTAGIAFERWFA